MTGQEFRDYMGDMLPKKLSKIGKYLCSDEKKYAVVVTDMKAVLK